MANRASYGAEAALIELVADLFRAVFLAVVVKFGETRAE
jgi:hypothetical protein